MVLSALTPVAEHHSSFRHHQMPAGKGIQKEATFIVVWQIAQHQKFPHIGIVQPPEAISSSVCFL